MTSDYAKIRDGWIREVGLDVQIKAENKIDREERIPRDTVWDATTGAKLERRRDIAEILARRGEIEYQKAFNFPSETYRKNYDNIDWSIELD